jgi:hypothetical protein
MAWSRLIVLNEGARLISRETLGLVAVSGRAAMQRGACPGFPLSRVRFVTIAGEPSPPQAAGHHRKGLRPEAAGGSHPRSSFVELSRLD